MTRVAGLILGMASLMATAALASPAAPHGSGDVLSLRPAFERPLASIVARHGEHGPAPSVGASACDKDIDTVSAIAGVAFVAAQDNGICTTGDLSLYEKDGDVYVAQAGGEEAAFTITRIAADGTPTLVTQKYWAQANTYTADIHAFKQGARRYVSLALERLALNDAVCGIAIFDVTDAPVTTLAAQVTGSDWCDVHNNFVEPDGNGDGKYLYLTADGPKDMRVLDIGNLAGINEIGRYRHPQASNSNYVHDITVIDHGGAIGRRVYVAYWAAGLMILNAADVTPGVVEAGSPRQPLNPNFSIDPPGFLTHHAYPSQDGTRVFIEDEFLQSAGAKPVQMWDISSPATPSYVDGISLGSSLMPVLAPAHNLLVAGNRLYVGWYKAGLQAFDFNSSGFVSRPVYHQVQTEPSDHAYDGAWSVDLATIGTTTYVFQSDRRYGLIVDSLGALDTDADGVPDGLDNCPAWPNPGQNLPPWPVPAGDPDCDGWTTGDEGLIGTNPNNHCGADWPANISNSGASANKVDIFDVNRLAPPVFFSTSPGPPYQPRFDLMPSGAINIFDVNRMGPPVFFATCTP